ncbi:MAG: hypothetical protein Q8939_08970 [Bacteroidota bacterium]|nr:hypothetical protein [Bacteroidota bacterium]
MNKILYRRMMRRMTLVGLLSSITIAGGAQTIADLPGNGVTETRIVDPRIDDPGKPWCYLQKSTTLIGVPYMPDAVQVTYDGAVYTRNAELCFFYGNPLRPVLARQKSWLNGWIPVIEYSWEDQKIKYAVELFGFPLNGEDAGNTLQFIKVKIINKSGFSARPHFAVATRSTGEEYRFEAGQFNPAWIYGINKNEVVRNNKLIYTFSGDGHVDARYGNSYAGPFKANDLNVQKNTPVCLVNYSPALKSGASSEYIFKMPRIPVDTENRALILKINEADFAKYRAQTIHFWENLVLKDRSTFSIPEKHLNEALKASLVHMLLATRERDGKRFMTDGLPYPDLFLTSFIQHADAFDCFGFKEFVDQSLPDVYAKQDSAGLFYDGALLHGKKLGVAQGQVIQTLCSHYLLTQDGQYLDTVYPKIKAAVDWLKNAVMHDHYYLMPPAWPYDNEMIQGHYTSNNLWAILGLRSAIRIARDRGESDDVRDWTEFQEFYKLSLLKAIKITFSEKGYVAPGLYDYLTGGAAREGFEDWQTNQEWENMLLVYPSELLSADNPIVDSTLDHIRNDRYREGIMTYRIFLHQYITINMMDQELARGDSRQALIDLYNVLLHLGSTYEGFENLVKPWQDRNVNPDVPPPHAWASSKLVCFMRNMLVREYGGDAGLDEQKRSLYLFSLISPAWCRTGREVAIHDARTEMGTISASMHFTASGAVVKIKPVFHILPKNIVITIPYFVRLVKFTSDASKAELKGRQLFLSPDVRNVKCTWEILRHYEEGSFADLLKRYRSESVLQVVDHKEKITPGRAYLRPDERNHSPAPLSFDLVKKAFVHEYANRFKEMKAAGVQVDTVAAPPLIPGN